MHLTGIQLFLVFLAFLAVLLAVGLFARGGWPAWSPRRPREDPPIVDETGPYEVPDETSPSRSDD